MIPPTLALRVIPRSRKPPRNTPVLALSRSRYPRPFTDFEFPYLCTRSSNLFASVVNLLTATGPVVQVRTIVLPLQPSNFQLFAVNRHTRTHILISLYSFIVKTLTAVAQQSLNSHTTVVSSLFRKDGEHSGVRRRILRQLTRR